MKKILSIPLLMATIFLMTSHVFAATNMKPGLWKMSAQMEMPGMPMKMPTVTYNKCLTKKDLVPKRKSTNNDCQMLNNKVNGDTVTWKMKCNNPGGASTMDGKVTYSGKSMKGIVNVNQGGRQMLQRISGQHVGPCK